MPNDAVYFGDKILKSRYFYVVGFTRLPALQGRVVSVKAGAVKFYDAKTRALLRSLQTGRGAGICMDVEHNRALVSCSPDDFVSVMDLETLEETRRIVVGRPEGIGWAHAH